MTAVLRPRLRALPGALLLGAALAVAGPALASTADTATPVALPSSASTAAGTTVSIPLRGTSPSGAALQYRLALFASYGDVSISGSTATYTPRAGFSGSDHFAFLVSDGASASDPVDVTVTVAAPVVVAPPAPPAPAAPVTAAPVARSAAPAPSASTPASAAPAPVASVASPSETAGTSAGADESSARSDIAAALRALSKGLSAAAESIG
ncbi:Ig-like domain-containing protein [Schumannella soli]|uniref:Uncharacterized protein n=1 Tax=Schumannella soli TaxID=2590779 RepID=A0A506Y6U1_9MICO|nr:Ig-like domain-containing protein [Schumannella soli]TPW76129.1 hypothetical protein FJ657_09960 [Schumannella soli]